MPSRRQFMQAGLGAIALGLLRQRSAWGLPIFPLGPASMPSPLRPSRPFLHVPTAPRSVMIDDLPFAAGFSGDGFPNDDVPFHVVESQFPGRAPPEPTETVDIAIVGGGLSGLTTAYLLRERFPVLFELHERFGGVSAGEVWDGTHYSLGGAYFITPDRGTFLDSFYHELGLDRVYRLSNPADDPVELHGKLIDSLFSSGLLRPDEVVAFRKYFQILAYYVENYPEIPLPERDAQWIVDLDWLSLKEDLERQMAMPIPPLLHAAIQGYCHSSFDAGMEQISAAAGWNFIAAEEFGRWVCPGGNAWVTDVLWQRLIDFYSTSGRTDWTSPMRPGTRVVDVRPAGAETDRRGARQRLFQVTYRDTRGRYGSMLARRVVMACSKHVCKHILHDLDQHDFTKLQAMHQVYTHPYMVVNVLLHEPVALDFYDIFLLGDGTAPMSSDEASRHSRVTDILSGDFAEPPNHPRSVLTLYWPLPFGVAMFHLLTDPWETYARQLAPQAQAILELLRVPPSAVRQIRMTRWGHAMPIARRGFIADGTAAELRRPYLDHVYFVNQDNWALPAFETCLLEAQAMSAQIDSSL